jgi:hypothetical protein
VIFEISNCSFSTHFQTLAIGWRYVITPPPFVNLFLSKPICCFLLIETLQFTIPVEKIGHKLHMKWGFQEKGYEQYHYILSFNCEAVTTGMDCFFVSSLKI